MSTETTIEIEPLTKSDVTALRTADDVYANVYEGKCTLTAVKRKPYGTDDPWADDKRHEIVVNYSTMAYGDHAGTRFDWKPTTCFASFGINFGGVAGIVKTGDRIKLLWQADAKSSETLRAVNYHGDALYLEIIRASDTLGRRPLRFLISTYIGPNNTARMCR